MLLTDNHEVFAAIFGENRDCELVFSILFMKFTNKS